MISAHPVARLGGLEALGGDGGSLPEAGSRREAVVARSRVGKHLVLVAWAAGFAVRACCAREGACTGTPGLKQPTFQNRMSSEAVFSSLSAVIHLNSLKYTY